MIGRLLTPGDRRDQRLAEITALREVRGRLSQCQTLQDVRALVSEMMEERGAEVMELDELERQRLDELTYPGRLT